MSSRKIGVLVSGRGSNLQSVLDRIADGYLPLEIAVASTLSPASKISALIS